MVASSGPARPVLTCRWLDRYNRATRWPTHSHVRQVGTVGLIQSTVLAQPQRPDFPGQSRMLAEMTQLSPSAVAMSLAPHPTLDRIHTLTRQLAVAADWGLDDVPAQRAPCPPAAGTGADDAHFLALPAAQDLRFNLEPFADVRGHRCTTPAGLRGLPLRMLRRHQVPDGTVAGNAGTLQRAVLHTLLHEQATGRTYLEQLAAHLRNQQGELHRAAACGGRCGSVRETCASTSVWPCSRLSKPCSVPPLTPTTALPALSTAVVGQSFAQTWLPEPPAQVLNLDAGDELGLRPWATRW